MVRTNKGRTNKGQITFFRKIRWRVSLETNKGQNRTEKFKKQWLISYLYQELEKISAKLRLFYANHIFCQKNRVGTNKGQSLIITDNW